MYDYIEGSLLRLTQVLPLILVVSSNSIDGNQFLIALEVLHSPPRLMNDLVLLQVLLNIWAIVRIIRL